MFLHSTMTKNRELLDICFQSHQNGWLLPDSYVIDLDTLLENAKRMLETAKEAHIALYFMLKQFGRNPYIAKALVDLGYEGAVVVDFKEAKIMMEHEIPISNVGHLVQMPKAMIQELVDYGCKYMTVFSLKKIRDIDECARKSGIKQKVMLRVVGKNDLVYSGQSAGFRLEELTDLLPQLRVFHHIEVAGVTSFPCFLYDEAKRDMKATKNIQTLLEAKKLLESNGFVIENVNAPSATCTHTLEMMKAYGIHSAEPGHGLSGTTPLHAYRTCIERPCVAYVSEVSHNFNAYGYCYGGGHYRRSHMEYALVGTTLDTAELMQVAPPNVDSIDYYLQLSKPCSINDTVIMAFRFQMFVTRSNVVILEGLHSQTALKWRIFDSLGREFL